MLLLSFGYAVGANGNGQVAAGDPGTEFDQAIKFSELLEYYIKHREQMTVLTKQVDKDELVKHLREQLKNM